jgi:hypothetical protein
MSSAPEQLLRGVLAYPKEENCLFYALVIFIGTHVYTIDNDLSWTDCQRAVSVSSDSELMKCVEDQEV